MKLVLDTNRFIAALLKESTSRFILTHPSFEFFTPVELLAEVEKYKGDLMEKSGLDEVAFSILQNELLDNVYLVSMKLYDKYMDKAIETMKSIDVKDAPFVAIGLALHLDGIWSDDKHFLQQSVLKVYTTKQMVEVSCKKS
jgi:predicted nucleic acid-binding protein